MYQIAIISAGPAGLSAAGRAVERDRPAKRATPSYVLLEGFAAHAKTIQRYQKGKHVMAEPGSLDLRSGQSNRAAVRATAKALLDWITKRDSLSRRQLAAAAKAAQRSF